EWELAAVMRQAAMTSAHRPTAKTFESPVSSGIDAPGYYDFQKYGISLPETLENAGFLEPLTWGITKYGEWSNLFIAVNGRTPTQKEMAPIANEGNGPSPTNATLRMFGDFRKFKKFAIQYSEARSHLLLNGVENRLRSGELPRNIVLDVGSGEELVRRTARFDVLNSLLPSNPLMESLKLCLYDVTDDELINYWSRHHTIPGWMIESAAWKINRLPELFPNGTLARALLIDDKK
ncbi:MAG TPA: hypothetical protein VFW90_03285, partial [Candidatus Saccharimonadales bacterium]|nr:hypothetical protein [Candidatus Saccharimonadales bacterium]